jgi:hypothetical protein
MAIAGPYSNGRNRVDLEERMEKYLGKEYSKKRYR